MRNNIRIKEIKRERQNINIKSIRNQKNDYLDSLLINEKAILFLSLLFLKIFSILYFY